MSYKHRAPNGASGEKAASLNRRSLSAHHPAKQGQVEPKSGPMIEVVNRQRKRPIDCERWQAFAAKALKLAPAGDADVTVVFVSDRAMREINRIWRGKRGTTDVLSFPANQDEFERLAGLNLGDVVISVEQASRQATEHGLSFENEVSQLILHGLLHLCGYDHETDRGETNRLELRLRKRLGI